MFIIKTFNILSILQNYIITFYINFPPLRRRFLAEPPANCGLGACSGRGVNAGEGVGHICLGVKAADGVGQDWTLHAISL